MTHLLFSYFDTLLSKTPSSGRALPELDGLRGFAVLIVIASHSNLLSMRGQGAMGVWLFYVLSGFLLTNILLATLPQSLSAPGLKKYLIRRVARILPLYYLCLVAVAVLLDRDLGWLFLHATFQRANHHFWSIPQEELFYVLLPVLVAIIIGLNRITSLSQMWLSLVLLVAVQTSFPLLRLHGNARMLPFYINVFIIGFFIAFLSREEKFRRFLRSPTSIPVVNAGSLLVLATILFTAPAHMDFYHRHLGVPIVALAWRHTSAAGALCGALLLATLKPGTWANRFFSWKPLRILGILSFSLYLVHWFVLAKLSTLFQTTQETSLFLTTLIASTLVALVLERWVERPAMRLGRRATGRYDVGAPQ